MRGSCGHRVVSALLAAMFALSAVAQGWLDACPMHSRVAGMDAAMESAMDSATPTAMHCAMPGMHAATPPAATSGPAISDAGSSNDCSCPASYCSSSRVSVRAVSLQLGPDLLAAAPDHGRPQHEYVAAWVDFVLPFATAPPTSALA